MSLSLRIQQAADKLDRLRPLASLAELNSRGDRAWPKQLTAIEAAIDKMVSSLDVATATPDPVPALTNPQRNASAVQAIATWLRTAGAAILQSDSVHRQIVEHAPEDHRRYWEARPPSVVIGLVRTEIAPALESEGILAWLAEPSDGHIRLVDTRWLTAHADIFQHVNGEWAGGLRCRFCRVTEIGTSNQLHPIPGRKWQAHRQCLPHWERIASIASRYSTLEEAQAADKQAGRESKAPPPMAEPEPKALPSAINQTHYNSREQGA